VNVMECKEDKENVEEDVIIVAYEGDNAYRDG
jgi:hypothetical protein